MHKLSGLLIFLVWSITAQAQTDTTSSKSINITVNATVVQRIEMKTIRDMNIGHVQPGQETISIDPITNAEAGKMVASGRPNARIRLSFPTSWDLSSSENDDPHSLLTFNYIVAANKVNNQPTAEILEPDNRSLKLNTDGCLYIWIGGKVDISDASPGNYQGNFTIEVEYI